MILWISWLLFTALACRICFIWGQKSLFNRLCDYIVNVEGKEDPRTIEERIKKEREKQSYLIMMEAMYHAMEQSIKKSVK